MRNIQRIARVHVTGDLLRKHCLIKRNGRRYGDGSCRCCFIESFAVQFHACFRDSFAESGIVRKCRIFSDDPYRLVARRADEFDILERFHAKIGHAPLPATEEVAGSSHIEVGLRKCESVVGLFERLQTFT